MRLIVFYLVLLSSTVFFASSSPSMAELMESSRRMIQTKSHVCVGDIHCCSFNSPCALGEGNCQRDDHCIPGLQCYPDCWNFMHLLYARVAYPHFEMSDRCCVPSSFDDAMEYERLIFRGRGGGEGGHDDVVLMEGGQMGPAYEFV